MVDEISSHARELSRRGAAKGGRARAQKLSKEELRAQNSRAASARWDKVRLTAAEREPDEEIPWALAEGALDLDGKIIPCAVLDAVDKNGHNLRVLTQQGVLVALGRARAAKGRQGGSTGNLPAFLAANNLTPFINPTLRESLRPVIFKPERGGYTWASKGFQGGIAFGYPATLLAPICRVYVDAAKAGVLMPKQYPIAEQARRLLEGLEEVGLVALVDEATGWEAKRAHHELQAILAEYVLPEHRPWVSEVPVELIKEFYRVWGWEMRSGTTQGPRYVSRLITKYIYKQLPKGVYERIDELNPNNERSQRPQKMFSYLTEDYGLPHFKSQLASVGTLLRISDTKEEFEQYFRKALRLPRQMMLDIELSDDNNDDPALAKQ